MGKKKKNNISRVAAESTISNVLEPMEAPWVVWLQPIVALENQDDIFSELVAAGAGLLAWIDQQPPILKRGFRIEFLPASSISHFLTLQPSPDPSHWFLTLKLNTVTWFSVFLKNKENDKSRDFSALDTATIFTKNAQAFEDALILQDQIQEFTEEPCVIREYCPFGQDCCNIPKCSKGVHAQWTCLSPIARVGGGNRKCLQYLIEELTLPISFLTDGEPPYFATASRDSFREVMLFPKAHKTNRDLVTSSSFWQRVIQCAQYIQSQQSSADESPLPVIEGVALNFGIWETRTSYDHRAIDCHGHAHILLTLAGFRALVSNRAFQTQLKGRVSRRSYFSDDIEPLLLRLLPDSHRQVMNEMASIKKSMASMQDNVTQRLDKLESLLRDALQQLSAHH